MMIPHHAPALEVLTAPLVSRGRRPNDVVTSAIDPGAFAGLVYKVHAGIPAGVCRKCFLLDVGHESIGCRQELYTWDTPGGNFLAWDVDAAGVMIQKRARAGDAIDPCPGWPQSDARAPWQNMAGIVQVETEPEHMMCLAQLVPQTVSPTLTGSPAQRHAQESWRPGISVRGGVSHPGPETYLIDGSHRTKVSVALRVDIPLYYLTPEEFRVCTVSWPGDGSMTRAEMFQKAAGHSAVRLAHDVKLAGGINLSGFARVIGRLFPAAGVEYIKGVALGDGLNRAAVLEAFRRTTPGGE